MTSTDLFESAIAKARWEIVPVRDPEKAIAALPERSTVTVGCFAKTADGYLQTLSIVERLSGADFHAVPHIPARSFDSKNHALEIAKRYVDSGVTEVFVVGGNADEPHGPFNGAIDLLRCLADSNVSFSSVGVAAYPEGHPSPAFDYYGGLREKSEFASYCVTQVCFDGSAIKDEARRLREQDIELPMHVGVPGVLAQTELLKLSRWMGIGNSMKFLLKQRKLATRLLRPTEYNPHELIEDLLPAVHEPASGIIGLHLNTFNQVARTREWVRGMLGTDEPLGAGNHGNS
ncbi:hypothetical protein BTO20_00815 [Mycobacterium dioxanotrophicus]|uniref:Methylenetetrahydrofolate reductase n=1 Tax=Mycobacterium dioxanotrophicus TaxID=482462 RepID=A0A1Y0BWQ7_9MYCO|nr:methylenetetrahydrofolate reductase [Mycobacterium dioxanotrophicus]ART67332.1 hypothetical protein BTO20_00815 [Mycobacterium dioxanotrophicus]